MAKKSAKPQLRSESMTFFCTRELRAKIEARAEKDQRTISQTIAILLAQALGK